MSFLCIFTCLQVLTILTFSQTCKYKPDTPKKDYYGEIPIICSDPNLSPSNNCQGAKHEGRQFECINLGSDIERCGCIESNFRRPLDVVIMLDASSSMTNALWKYYLLKLTKLLNDKIFSKTHDWTAYAYIIYGENTAEIMTNPLEYYQTNKLPNKFINNNGSNFCKALDLGINFIKTGEIFYKKETLLILVQFSTPIKPTINNPCLDKFNNKIILNEYFHYTGAFLFADPININMNGIELNHGYFDNCMYLDDFTLINGNYKDIYNKLDESENKLIRFLVSGISDFICYYSQEYIPLIWNTGNPTMKPTTKQPTTKYPTMKPTYKPTTKNPTYKPTYKPTDKPTFYARQSRWNSKGNRYRNSRYGHNWRKNDRFGYRGGGGYDEWKRNVYVRREQWRQSVKRNRANW